MKRVLLAAVFVLAASVFPAAAQNYSDIDVDLPAFPEMEPIQDSPVYWAPNVDSNYFFYDGLYWDYNNDGWYSSAWYNGPWAYVEPIYVPTYVLWVPVHYYHRAPPFFRGWHPNRPPHWTEHWGHDWQARHNAIYGGHAAAVGRAPLPLYQRQYSRANYPRAPQQYALHGQHYAYQPHEAVTRQHYESRGITLQRQPQDARRDDAHRERR